MPVLEIETPRLRLLAWTREDIDALHRLWTQPDVKRFLWDDIIIPWERARLGMSFEGETRIGELPALSYVLSREDFLRA